MITPSPLFSFTSVNTSPTLADELYLYSSDCFSIFRPLYAICITFLINLYIYIYHLYKRLFLST